MTLLGFDLSPREIKSSFTLLYVEKTQHTNLLSEAGALSEGL